LRPCRARRRSGRARLVFGEEDQKEKHMPATQQKLTAQQIEQVLANHIGSLERYRHWTGRFIYTPGVHDLAELAGAYWLIDLVASYCIDPRILGEEFVVWKLTVRPDHTATAQAEDGNDRVLLSQEIPATDFPLKQISLYLTDGVLLLPSEY
jgi:hypothetical protein